MKKLLATLLALSLVLCFALTANAATVGGAGVTDISTNNTVSNDVTITVNDASAPGETDTPTIYMVDVVWEAPALEYTITGDGEGTVITWDPINHKYDLKAGDGSDVSGSWTTKSFNIKVTNHSNDEIKADLELPVPQNGVTFSADKTTLTLDRADIGDSLIDKTKAPNDKFVVSADGTPNGSFTVSTTVTITPAT